MTSQGVESVTTNCGHALRQPASRSWSHGSWNAAYFVNRIRCWPPFYLFRSDFHTPYTRIKDYLVRLAYEIGETTVKNLPWRTASIPSQT